MITACSSLVNNWEQAVRTHLVDELFGKLYRATDGVQYYQSEKIMSIFFHCIFTSLVFQANK